MCVNYLVIIVKNRSINVYLHILYEYCLRIHAYKCCLVINVSQYFFRSSDKQKLSVIFTFFHWSHDQRGIFSVSTNSENYGSVRRQIISYLFIFRLISWSAKDIFSIMTMVRKIIGQWDVQYIKKLLIKTITSVLKVLTYIIISITPCLVGSL